MTWFTTDTIAAIAGSGGALVPIGAGVAWIWNKIERRFKSIEAKLLSCEARETVSHERRQVHVTVIELLWQELARFTGEKPNRTMNRAKKLLDDLKALPPMPKNDEIDRLLRRLDEKDK